MALRFLMFWKLNEYYPHQYNLFFNFQFLREQDLLLRERERRIELEKREREKVHAQPPITSPKTSSEDGRHLRPGDPSFHRPFERPLTNGYERNHYTDYERRAMNEAILAQDRHVLQNMPRSAASSTVPITSNHSLESRPYEQVFNDRSFLEKQHEGIQARLIESEKGQHSQPAYSGAQHQAQQQQPPPQQQHPPQQHQHLQQQQQQPQQSQHPQVQQQQHQPQAHQHHHQHHHQRPSKYDARHERPQQSELEYKGTSYHRQEENSSSSSSNNKAETAVPSVSQHFEKSMHSMNNGGSAHHHPMFKYEAVSPVICSKLDLEEQKMRESRLNGSYVSDDSDSEDVTVQDERRRERLLLIANGPPCAIEKSPRKLKFLKHFGLTTNEIRSGMLKISTVG